MRKFLFFFLIFLQSALFGQDLSIGKGWKFKTGDQPGWSSPTLNDSGWAPIQIGQHWKSQGFDYDGFAWYRLHIVIPSSIRRRALQKETLRINLGKIEDGDDVYLNGSLIGQNGGKGSDIKKGSAGAPRSYLLRLDDPCIHWDQDNVLAVRVWDNGVDGGLYDGNYGISVVDITDFIVIDTRGDFEGDASRGLGKKIRLESTSDVYAFRGQLKIAIMDPMSGATIYKRVIPAFFSKVKPFDFTYRATLPEIKSYDVTYTFEESKTRKKLTTREGTPYILTPPSSPAPGINGPTVFGVRPGSPFLYAIPAKGRRPIRYGVEYLPMGLVLDSATGIITGILSDTGSFPVRVSARNKYGKVFRKLTIICGDNIGLTPAMGWNSWNCWGISVSDEKVRASAKAMHDQLAPHGWTYINIDDGWSGSRNAHGEILGNEKFPDMAALSHYVHELGLKIGIYSSPGLFTCDHFTGSYEQEGSDARTYGNWGFDYLKYDWCSYDDLAPFPQTLGQLQKPYTIMRQALDSVHRDILYSLCQYGGKVWEWGQRIGGNSWRTMGDITDTWQSVSGIGFNQDKCAPFAGPGHFNDPDMLVVGKVGWGPSLHNTRLTPDEQYAHVSLWCLLTAPLLIGCDISMLDPFTMNLLTNDEVLAIDQDALAQEARTVFEKDGFQIWEKRLADGSMAVGIFNLGDKAVRYTFNFSSGRLPERLNIRDVWREKDLGSFRRSFTCPIPSHGVLLLRVKETTRTIERHPG